MDPLADAAVLVTSSEIEAELQSLASRRHAPDAAESSQRCSAFHFLRLPPSSPLIPDKFYDGAGVVPGGRDQGNTPCTSESVCHVRADLGHFVDAQVCKT